MGPGSGPLRLVVTDPSHDSRGRLHHVDDKKPHETIDTLVAETKEDPEDTVGPRTFSPSLAHAHEDTVSFCHICRPTLGNRTSFCLMRGSQQKGSCPEVKLCTEWLFKPRGDYSNLERQENG